jgi:hypothetical protein
VDTDTSSVGCSIARVRHHTVRPGGLSTRNVRARIRNVMARAIPGWPLPANVREEDYSSVDWLTPVAANTDGISARAIGMK